MDTKKLRQKILDLAIHGKLVPQDPNDEPASVLLERIRAEKERLIKEGKIKRSRKTTKTSDAACDKQEVPFEVPSGWVWTTLDEICSKIGSGSTPRGSNYSEDGIPFFRSQNVHNEGLVYEDIKFISNATHQSMIGTEVCSKDLLLNITGGSLGRCAIVPDDFLVGNVSQHVCIIRTICVLPSYVHAFILSSLFKKSMSITGSGREGLPKYNLEKMYLSLPPLAEQQRIVEEVERWFKLIDIIEQGKADLQSSIKQAKNKILDLAIHGKLVPQDPNELLKRINPKAEITCDNGHYKQLPSTWRVCSYKDIFTTISSRPFQIKQSEIKDKGKYPVVSQSLSYIEGYSDIECALKCDSSFIVFGDHTRIVKFIDFDFIVGADGVKIITSKINNKYAYFLLLYVSDKINNKGYSRHFSQIVNYKYSLPPFAEQLRIVDKIEKLLLPLSEIQKTLEM